MMLSPSSVMSPLLYSPIRSGECVPLSVQSHSEVIDSTDVISNTCCDDLLKDDNLMKSDDLLNGRDSEIPSTSPQVGSKKCTESCENYYVDVENVDDVDGMVAEVVAEMVMDEGKVSCPFKDVSHHTCSFCGQSFMNLDPFNEHMMSHFLPTTPATASSSQDQERPLRMVNKNFFKEKTHSQKNIKRFVFGKDTFNRKALMVGKLPVEFTTKKRRLHRSRGVHVYPSSSHALDSLKAELSLKTFQCLECEEEFVTCRSLKNHMERHDHLASVMSPTAAEMGMEMFRCVSCETEFVTASARLCHSREVHGMDV